MDWVNFTSAFRAATPEVVFPWPPLCCRRTGNFIPLNEEGCRLGHTDYLFTKVCPSLWLPCLCGMGLAPSGPSISSPLPQSSPPPSSGFFHSLPSLWLSQLSLHLSLFPLQVNGRHRVCLIPSRTCNFSSGCLGMRATGSRETAPPP